MLRTLLTATCLTGLAAMAMADGHLELGPRVAKLEAGIYCSKQPETTQTAPDTDAGVISLYDQAPAFISDSARVPAALGIGFGMRPLAKDGVGIDPVLMTVTHPPFGGSGTTRQSYISSIGGGEPSYSGYSFDAPEELAIGTWTFTATQGDDVLYTATFEVVPADLMPEILEICIGPPMS